MNRLSLALGTLTVLAAAATNARADSVTQTYLYDGSTIFDTFQYDFAGNGRSGDFEGSLDFLGLSNDGLTWHYRVIETHRDLSHFVLEICDAFTAQDVTDASHAATEFGLKDDVYGIKFDNLNIAGSQAFSFTLANVVMPEELEVYFKASKNGQLGTILAPGCDTCDVPVVPTPTAAAAGLIGLGVIGLRRRLA
jgi:MYXO-CTERM domain-containing protein